MITNSTNKGRGLENLPNAGAVQGIAAQQAQIYHIDRDRCKTLLNSLLKIFRGVSMSIFFQQTIQAMIAKHIDRSPPLLKLEQVID